MADWMVVLETVAQRPPDECNAEWEWLMKELGLGPDYFLAVYEAVRQGRWRRAQDPRAYLKTVAKREAAEMELTTPEDAVLIFPGEIESDGEMLSQEERLDYMQHQYDNPRASQGADGVWRTHPNPRKGGAVWGPRRGVGQRERGNYRDSLMTRVPDGLAEGEEPSEELKEIVADINANIHGVYIRLKPLITANWAQWAEAAGLDRWEQEVLRCKLDGVSRKRAMEEQPDEGSRKALQAAWRRFDRNGEEKLLEAAKKFSVENVPE